jgi:cobalamin-dependent methionine synthase I
MVIIGELINASRKTIAAHIEKQDAEAIRKIAREQFEAGVDYIDVNAGTFVGKEADYIKWLVTQVQAVVAAPCCLDSPDPAVIEAGLSVHQGTPMINSISLEKDRYDQLLPLVAGTDFKVVALCMSNAGMPKTVDDRLAIAEQLVNGLLQNHVKIDNIYVDPLVQPLSVNQDFGKEFLNSIDKIMTTFKGIHTVCGLSNISYGLPNRQLLNQLFMVMAIERGLDAAIVDPLDQRMMANIAAAEALTGKDAYCMNYLKGHRSGKFKLS